MEKRQGKLHLTKNLNPQECFILEISDYIKHTFNLFIHVVGASVINICTEFKFVYPMNKFIYKNHKIVHFHTIKFKIIQNIH